MKNMKLGKKLWSILLTMVMVFALFVPAMAANEPTTDIVITSGASDAVYSAWRLLDAKEDENGKFKYSVNANYLTALREVMNDGYASFWNSKGANVVSVAMMYVFAQSSAACSEPTHAVTPRAITATIAIAVNFLDNFIVNSSLFCFPHMFKLPLFFMRLRTCHGLFILPTSASPEENWSPVCLPPLPEKLPRQKRT